MMTLAQPARTQAAALHGLDVERIRADFPILSNVRVDGRPLVYLDNAASAQMPVQVIERLVHYQKHEHANIHRGVHELSDRSTAAYEGARGIVQRFLNAREAREIVFTRGTTESINLVMQGWGRAFIGEGDEIILSQLEHHSNIVPWQMLRDEKRCKLRVIPCNDAGELLVEEYEKLLNSRTRLVCVTHVANSLGTVVPVKEMIAIAHRHGVPVLVDGAQAAPHMAVDVRDLDCDFYAFSGHKVFGPTGIGVLYGKASLLEKMRPYQGGGHMILSVTFEKTTYAGVPERFEAGTPPIAAAVGLGAAIEYLEHIGLERIAAHEHALLERTTEALGALRGVRIIGSARHKAAVLSFVLDEIHAHDVGTILNSEGVAVRTGHHCAQPVMQRFGVPATARASFAFYNTFAEVDVLVAAIRKAQSIFS